MTLDPVDDQVADQFTRAIDNRRVLVHRVAAAAVDAIVIRGQTELLPVLYRLAFETQVLNALANRFRDIQIVGHAFGNIEVVRGDLLINQIRRRLARLVSAKVFCRMLERFLQLLARDFQHDERVLVNIKARDLAHSYRAPGNARAH